MCRRVTCERCGKATYAGCGAHVEQVLAGVSEEQRCRCRAEPPARRAPIEPKEAARQKKWSQ